MEARRYTFDRVTRLLIGAMILVSLYALVAYLRDVLVPFAIAFLGAYLLYPLVMFVQRCGIRRRFFATLLTLLLLLLLTLGVGSLLAPPLIRQGQHLGQLLLKFTQDKNISERIAGYLPPEWIKAGRDFLRRPEVIGYLHPEPLAEILPPEAAAEESPENAENPAKIDIGENPRVPESANDAAVNQVNQVNQNVPPEMPLAPIASAPPVETSWWEDARHFFTSGELFHWAANDRVLTTAHDAASKVMPVAINWFGGIFSGIISFLISVAGCALIVLYLIYILRDYENIRENWKALIPPEHRERVIDFVRQFDSNMSAYFRAQAVISLCCGVVMAIGFALVGLPLGILLGLFCGVLSMVPYLQAVGFIPAALLALIYSLDTGTPFWLVATEVAAVFAITQLIYDFILIPKFMGEATKLNPAIILLSLSIWWKLLGLLGFVIALPMTCLILVYYRRIINHHEQLSGG